MIAAYYLHKLEVSRKSGSRSSLQQVYDLAVKDFAHEVFDGKPVPLHRSDSQALHDRASVNICFASYPGVTSCRIISLGEVLIPDPLVQSTLRDIFRNKIVLIGRWQVADLDFKSTPLLRRVHNSFASEESDRRFGVEIHAHIIHTLLPNPVDADHGVPGPPHVYREFDENRLNALVWMCGLLTALLVARFRPILALMPVAGILVIVLSMVWFSFQHFVFLRPVEIGIAIIFAYVPESVYFYGVENRRASLARSTFQRYVGPRVMERVLDTNFKPGTVEQRHLTIMFTDVQGFTSISEKMPPQQVVDTFNRYLNDMVEILDKHGGTLDKIMGDGIMAYFNAPLPLDRHEQKAVECALEMQAAMRSWRELSENLGLPPLKVRIGINCGDVVFGEVGAKRQLGYTVIGDAVNAAARLEPLNKQFGTEILISEEVREALDDTIETEYVGKLDIRGREEGIRAYSVTGIKKTKVDSRAN
jgi:adenylate cyclase